MALMKRLSYQWRLFFPLVALLWSLIIVLVFFQYQREVDYRTNNIHRQLGFINNRIINAYENDLDMVPFMNFVAQYFNHTLFKDVVVSVYDDKDNLIYCIGTPILPENAKRIKAPELVEAQLHGVGAALRKGTVYTDEKFYFSARKSQDGKIFVHTAMPYKLTVADTIATWSSMWVIIFSIVIIVTIIAFYAARYFGRNITLLRDFANRAATDNDFTADNQFPSDELGEISRQIVKMYR